MKYCLKLFIVSALVFTAGHNKLFGQVKYVSGHNEWDPDSLGNHRAVVQVTKPGIVAKAVIEWRRRDDPAGKEIIVVDSATNKRIINVSASAISRESGAVYFEPLSGRGTYYIYYMPYHIKKGSNYPNAIYLKWNNHADEAWLAKIKDENTVAAQLEYLESVNALNSFYPMEVIATHTEVARLTAAQNKEPFLVFPEDRLHPIKMVTDIPQRWILRPYLESFRDIVSRGENFAFQLGVYADKNDLQNVRIKFTNLKDETGHVIPAKLFSCLNTDGTNWDNTVLKKTVNVPQGHVQAMWCLINMPVNIVPGVYNGIATVQANGLPAVPVKIMLMIKSAVLADGGVNEPWKQTRLTWLNSSLAQKNDVIKPYIPLKLQGNTISLLGRKLSIASNGLPAQITTYFTEEMTSIGKQPNNILSAPFEWVTQLQNGAELKWISTETNFIQTGPGTVNWSAVSHAPGMLMQVNGSLEFDGFVHYTVRVIAQRDREIKEIAMSIPFKKDVAQYMMGLNLKGEKMPADYNWKWDVAHKNQDGAWIGAVNAGLQFSLRDQHYVRPLNTNFYLEKPLILPTSWGNDGAGGIDISSDAKSVIVKNYSGSRRMKKGDTLYYDFNLMITPFHPINTEQQWALRFYHHYNNVDTIKATGATVINIHHGTPINPYINYPFIAHAAMKAYIDSAHDLGLKVKIYNTVRELSNSAYEIFPLRSLGHEVYSTGKGGGYSWLQEHLGSDYIAGWYVPEVKDAAVVNSGMSRWHNYYVEGMNWLVNNVGIDGIYLDDVAYDRTTMKRIKRVLTQNGHPGIIDLHSANQYDKADGFNNSANLYMDHFPYLNRLWFGEYFDYEHNDPAFFLVEVSGIPYGLMGEMLQGGGNPWRGMIYGMTNRMPWTANADPRPIWKAWDDFGIKGSRMIGYWVKSNPVKTNDTTILATVYKKNKSAMVAIASWAATDKMVKLSIDWKGLGIDPAKAVIIAPYIKNFQPENKFSINDSIPVEKNKGWLLIIRPR
jgi:hypothetical protein